MHKNIETRDRVLRLHEEGRESSRFIDLARAGVRTGARRKWTIELLARSGNGSRSQLTSEKERYHLG